MFLYMKMAAAQHANHGTTPNLKARYEYSRLESD